MMNAYIFDKADRVVFNIVKDVERVENSYIYSQRERMVINLEADDFVITDQIISIGAVVPTNITNKEIFTKEQILQGQIDTLALQILDLMGV